MQKLYQGNHTLSPAKAIRYIRSDLGYDQAIKRICEAFGFSVEYIEGLLEILIAIARNERTIVGFANHLSDLEEQMKTSY